MAVFVFDFKKINAIVDGEQVVGFADGSDPISFTFMADDFTSRAGIKGDVSYARTNDERAEVTFKLLHTSPTNAKFRSLRGQQFDIAIVDSNDEGQLKASATNCVVKREPDGARGSEVGVNEWTFIIPKLTIK